MLLSMEPLGCYVQEGPAVLAGVCFTSPKQILFYLGQFNTNYIIFRNDEME
jgi:hypothetical protein